MTDDFQMDRPPETPRKGRGGWLSRLSWNVLTVLVIVGGVLGYMALSALRPTPGEKPIETRSQLVEVAQVRAESGPVPVTGSGFVAPVREIALAPRVTGAVSGVHPDLQAGAKITAGDVLVQLDPRPFQTALDQARADRQSAEAQLTFARRQIERVKSLNQRGFASEERLDELQSQRDQASARLAQLDALIEQRTLDLEFAQIRAPFDGRVISETVALGAVVQVGTELARLYANDAVEIVVPLEERRAVLIPGLWSAEDAPVEDKPEASVGVDYAGRRYVWDGHVERAEAEIDRGTRTLDVVVQVQMPDRAGRLEGSQGDLVRGDAPFLRPGMFASVTIAGRTVEGRYSIPREALRLDNEVWVVREDNTLGIIRVRLVAEDGARISVLAPELEPGTRVVVSSLPFAVEGMGLRIAGETEPSGEQGAPAS